MNAGALETGRPQCLKETETNFMKNFLAVCTGLALLALPLSAAQVEQNVHGARSINILTLRTNANDGETFSIAGNVFEIDLNPTNAITTGRIRIDLSTNGVQASGVLTFTNQVENGDQFTLGDRTYQFDTTLINTDGHVLIGASKAASITNLYNAINKTTIGGSVLGTDYAAVTTPHSNAYAASLTTGALTVKSRSTGVGGNSIAFTRAWATNIGMGSVTALASGAGPNPATDPFLSTNIVRTINQSNTVRVLAQVINTNQILITSLIPGSITHSNGETMAGSVWAWDFMYGGVGDDPIKPVTSITRVARTNEMQLGQAHFFFPFAPRVPIVQIITTATGVPVAWNGAITVSGNRLTLDNSGSTDWGSNETFRIIVSP